MGNGCTGCSFPEDSEELFFEKGAHRQNNSACKGESYRGNEQLASTFSFA